MTLQLGQCPHIYRVLLEGSATRFHHEFDDPKDWFAWHASVQHLTKSDSIRNHGISFPSTIELNFLYLLSILNQHSLTGEMFATGWRAEMSYSQGRGSRSIFMLLLVCVLETEWIDWRTDDLLYDEVGFSSMLSKLEESWIFIDDKCSARAMGVRRHRMYVNYY